MYQPGGELLTFCNLGLGLFNFPPCNSALGTKLGIVISNLKTAFLLPATGITDENSIFLFETTVAAIWTRL